MKKTTCKTCGADMPDGQDICPECGCVTYGRKIANPKTVLFCGIIAFAYALYGCIRDIISTQDFRSFVPRVLFFGIITLIYGIISIIQKQNKVMNILGMSLVFVAIICSVCVNTFYDNNYREETVQMKQISVKFTFLCPTDSSYEDEGIGLDFYKKGTNSKEAKYAFSVSSSTFAKYKEYLNEYSDKCKKVEKINEYLYVYYFDNDFDFVALYDDETELLVEMIFEERKYKNEIIKILTSMEIEKDPKITIYSPRASLGLERTKY